MSEEQTQQMSSVEITTSTKGYHTFKVKVYNLDPDSALIKAKELADKARTYCDQHNDAI